MVLFLKIYLYTIGPPEVEQFAYDVNVKLDAARIVVTTDESDVSAFLKVLVDHGASRVEVFSAHFYKEGQGFID